MSNYETDKNGFLLNFDNWDMNFCKITSKEENIDLQEDHILIINFLRSYYKENKKSPAIRILVSELKNKYGDKIGNSLYLQILFPNSPAVQAAKISGLPKPKRCI